MFATLSFPAEDARKLPGRLPEVLALQGWAADRYTDRGMVGAGLLAGRTACAFGLDVTTVGEPGEPEDAGWERSLERARPHLQAASAQLDTVMARGARPIVFANRCAASIATIPVVVRHRPDALLVWIDAHGDYNTPGITPTGYLGGMVISALCGEWNSGFGAGLEPRDVVHVGGRDLDPAEAGLMRARGVGLIGACGAPIDLPALQRAVEGRAVWLHIDCDSMDPSEMPAEYKVPGGLSRGQLREIVELISSTSAELIGLEMTEFEAPTDTEACARSAADLEAVFAPAMRRLCMGR